jgi:hypothetical protein
MPVLQRLACWEEREEMTNASSPPWTHDEDERLMRLWSRGFTAGDIEQKMEGNRTRSAICGRIKRLRENKTRPQQVSRRKADVTRFDTHVATMTSCGRCGTRHQIEKGCPNCQHEFENMLRARK